MPAGRPTEYRPEYCEEIIALMATGLSLTAAAADLGFHRGTLYKWEENYPEFGDAIKLARGKRVAALERELLATGDGPRVTARIFALKNADQKEWGRADRIAIGGDPDAPPVKAQHSYSPEAGALLADVLSALKGG